MTDHIIVFNAGSSSLKFSLFKADGLSLSFHGKVDDLSNEAKLMVMDRSGEVTLQKSDFPAGHKSALSTLISFIASHSSGIKIIAAGHRVVHGGRDFISPVKVSPEVLSKLRALIPLAPLHQPNNIAAIEAFQELHPKIPQIACFDTAFHSTQSKCAKSFAIPTSYADEGIIRYGFHGLSYEYIASVLPQYAGDKANGKVIIAHLGNGASMCAMTELKSVSTTMGFTTVDGLMMGTRSGNIDPGVVLYLMEEKKMSSSEIRDLLYNKSGLKGVSGISHDMRTLLASDSKAAKDAIELFCYQASKNLASLIPSIGGLDVLVFTAGIGEKASLIRKNICESLSWLGVSIDNEANNTNKSRISASNSKIEVLVIPTNEELIIARSVGLNKGLS